MTGAAVFLGVFVAVIVGAWVVTRCRDWRREALEKAVARQEATARHPSHVPGLPVDGDPLSEDEYSEYTGILLSPVRDPKAGKNSPPAEGKR